MSLLFNNNVGYTIQGTGLSIVDGVASGFSASDYLKISQSLDTTKPFEMRAKFKYNSLKSIPQTIFGVPTSGVLSVSVSNTGKLRMFVGDANIYQFNIAYIVLDTDLTANTYYFLKCGFDLTKYYLALSTDGINWIEEKTVDNIAFIYGGTPITVRLGNGHSTNWYLDGSIDLNNTYIKVNGITWFNGKETASSTVNDVYLNHNVGYTIVGSPTINDGVVSGCDYDNYLNLNSLFPNSNNSNMDVFITLKSAGIGTGKGYRNVFSNLCGILIALTSSSTPTFTVYTKKSGESTYTARNIYNYSVQVNSNNNFYLHFTKNGNVLSIQGANNDGVFKTASTYTLEEGEEIALNSNYPEVMRAGAWGNIENSAIDLNNTYIKVNGITWFNGKETASSTVNEVYYNKNCGYTVVGSPTISNGVVSGFSTDNYILLPSIYSKNISELVIKIKLNSSVLGQNVYTNFLRGPSTFQGYTYCGTNAFIYTGFNIVGLGDVRINHNLQPDTDYWLKYTNDGTNCTAWWSEDGINYTAGNIKESSLITDNNPGMIRIGNRSDRLAFPGSIDLNETYIKVNGITFFNGKDVNFSKQNNYIINNGNLVWANPNLWLQGDKNSYIDTGITATNYITFDITAKKGTLSQGWIFGGAGSAYNVDNLSLRWYENGQRVICYINGNYGLSNVSSTVYGNKYWVKSYIQNGIYYVNFNDLNIPSINTTDFTSNTISLFSYHRDGGYVGFSDETIYNMKLYNNGTLVRNLVPVPKGLVIGNYTVPSNGMWDIVTQTFFANQGTGNFTFGKDGTTPVWTRGV